jgi:thioredoxin-related protein
MTSRGATLLLALLVSAGSLHAQTSAGPYDPKADPAKELSVAAERAGRSGRLVLAVVGGNWCVWCLALDRLMNEDAELRKVLAAGFEVVHVNHSKENRNEAVLEKLARPDKKGFPVLVVLSKSQKILHVQETGSLELPDRSVKGHDREKVLAFLKAWTPKRQARITPVEGPSAAR